ncbi:LOG family protein YvdD [Andreprevotia sp. IGB-42]|uniref:LOG family protein n=1 Tax=Andreprevotia sp. IGB-42 TaxID=2497473 RepID=UPI0013574967|nr:TIGR00730 family Rossman fold protein [Andreprevotia sp. IGB-42]KAF0814257.1 LOG family protein YvdD [Andreprevotia sp. IGB-42]
MKSVAVFCGSRHGANPAYGDAARATGRLLAEQGLTLVYGGGHVGLMGEVAQSCLQAGGRVIGVIPEFMVGRELALVGCTELHVVDSMHTRKAMMADLADAFIALPGGFGTFDELFEILTWGQIGLHGKPVGVLDVAGYYSGLQDFLQKTVQEGFVHDAECAKLQFADEPARLLELLMNTPVLPTGWAKADWLVKT